MKTFLAEICFSFSEPTHTNYLERISYLKGQCHEMVDEIRPWNGID
jgi:hypothetical protein